MLVKNLINWKELDEETKEVTKDRLRYWAGVSCGVAIGVGTTYAGTRLVQAYKDHKTDYGTVNLSTDDGTYNLALRFFDKNDNRVYGNTINGVSYSKEEFEGLIKQMQDILKEE